MSSNIAAALEDPLHVNLDKERMTDATTAAKRRAVTQGLDEDQVKKAVEEAAQGQDEKQQEAEQAAKESPGVVGKDA